MAFQRLLPPPLLEHFSTLNPQEYRERSRDSARVGQGSPGARGSPAVPGGDLETRGRQSGAAGVAPGPAEHYPAAPHPSWSLRGTLGRAKRPFLLAKPAHSGPQASQTLMRAPRLDLQLLNAPRARRRDPLPCAAAEGRELPPPLFFFSFLLLSSPPPLFLLHLFLFPLSSFSLFSFFLSFP